MKLFFSLIFSALIFHAGIVAAQEASNQKEPGQEEPSLDGEQEGGFVQPVLYVAETFKNWQRVCLKIQNTDDPCHLYQLIKNENDHPVGEVNLFRIEDQEGISAAATITVPHETLLTAKLGLVIDDGERAEFPFSWCDTRGCYARLAFTDDDILDLKKGSKVIITIQSISAPGEVIALELSLLGFTAAFGSI